MITLTQLAKFLAKDKWCKGTDARDRFGLRVPFDDATACCWCLSGAVWKMTGTVEQVNELSQKIQAALEWWLDRRGKPLVGFVSFNDNIDTTWADLQEMLTSTPQ